MEHIESAWDEIYEVLDGKDAESKDLVDALVGYEVDRLRVGSVERLFDSERYIVVRMHFILSEYSIQSNEDECMMIRIDKNILNMRKVMKS